MTERKADRRLTAPPATPELAGRPAARTRLSLSLAIAAVCVSLFAGFVSPSSSLLFAQVNERPEENTRPAVTPAQERPTAASAAGKSDGIPSTSADELLFQHNGQLIPLSELLPEETIIELLNRVSNQISVPQFELKQVELSGKVEKNVIRIQAELRIDVQPETEWVTVPVAFQDFHLTNFSHSSENDSARSVPDNADPSSRRWHLFGKGLHILKLDLIGQTRVQQPSGYQLNLNLPKATISHARIEFDRVVELQKTPQDPVQSFVREGQGVRAVEFWGLTTGTTLTWVDIQPVVDRKPVIQVQNRMKMDLTTIPVTLSGVQTIQITGGPVSELRIQFPEGFQLLEIAARNQAGVSVLGSFEVSPNSAGPSAIVRLTGAVEGNLTVSFDLELVNRTFPQDIQVRLPQVGDARVQSGDLDIAIPPGLVTRIDGAQRKRVTSETDSSVPVTAFRLRSMDSVVVAHVEEIEAQYAVSPEIIFQPDEQNVLMTARIPVNVLRGSLLELPFRWPGYSSGIWQILPGTTRLTTDNQGTSLLLEPSSIEQDSFLLAFKERQSGQFTVEFRAFATLPAIRSPENRFVCLEAGTRPGQPVVITTIESDQYSLRPLNAETGRILTSVPFSSDAVSEAAQQNRRAQTWLHDTPSSPIRFDLVDQAPSVTAEMVVGLSAEQAGIHVHQQIDFQIEHRDLATLSLNVPNGLQPIVRIMGEAEPLRATLDAPTTWSFRLPRARRGELKIEVDYLWPDADQSVGKTVSTFQMPVIQPLQSEVIRWEVGTNGAGLQLNSADPWKPVYSDRFEAAWATADSVREIPLIWQRLISLRGAQSPIIVVHRTILTPRQAVTSSLGIFEVLPGQLSFLLPGEIVPESLLIGNISIRSGLRVADTKEGNQRRWTMSTSGLKLSNDDPIPVEIRFRETLTPTNSFRRLQSFSGAGFESEEQIPAVWVFESQNDTRIISQQSDQTLLNRNMLSFLSTSSSQDLRISQVDAILSPYPQSVQALVSGRLEVWMSEDVDRDIFFLHAAPNRLELWLIPGVSLLLVSAVVCVAIFLLMSVFRNLPMIIPVLLIAVLLPGLYLAFADWTSLMIPYVLIGLLFGIVSISFQRLASDRRIRLPDPARSGEMLTVFGVSGFLTGTASPSARADSDLSVAASGAELSAPSAR